MAEKKTKLKVLTSTDGIEGVLSTKYADIFTINYLPDNIKAHDKEDIKASIREFGFVEPIGINMRTGHDIFGNGRLECLREMFDIGEDVPFGIVEKWFGSNGNEVEQRLVGDKRKWFAPIVHGLDIDPSREAILAARLNKSSERGGIDPARAIKFLKNLVATNPDAFTLTGYAESEIEHIRRLAKFNADVQELRTPDGGNKEEEKDAETSEQLLKRLQRKWKVKKGDLWQLGQQMLRCADASEPFAYNSARLVFTSPPYDSQRSYELKDIDWTSMMDKVTETMFGLAGDPADIIINLGPVYENGRVKWYWNDWLAHCYEKQRYDYGFYVWDKLRGAAGETHGRLARSHEFFFHFKVGKGAANKWIETSEEGRLRGPKEWSVRRPDGSMKQGLNSLDTLGQSHKVPDSVVRLYPELARGLHTQGHPAVFPVALP